MALSLEELMQRNPADRGEVESHKARMLARVWA